MVEGSGENTFLVFVMMLALYSDIEEQKLVTNDCKPQTSLQNLAARPFPEQSPLSIDTITPCLG